jgi:hypothetical protein
VSEIRALRIFGPKRDEVRGGGRKLLNEELHNLYSSPSVIKMIKSRRMRWAGRVARVGEKRNVHRILVGRPEGRRPLGGLDTGVRWRDIMNSAMNLRVPSNVVKFLSSYGTGGFSRKTQLHGSLENCQFMHLILVQQYTIDWNHYRFQSSLRDGSSLILGKYVGFSIVFLHEYRY